MILNPSIYYRGKEISEGDKDESQSRAFYWLLTLIVKESHSLAFAERHENPPEENCRIEFHELPVRR